MSKMPAACRSFQRVVLKVVASLLESGSLAAGLKSGTAIRIFSTPRPVPVRIQSCGGAPTAAMARKAMRMIAASRFILKSRINQYRVSCGVNVACVSADSRTKIPPRRNSARLLDAHVRGLTRTVDLEVNVDPACVGDARIDLVLQPVVGDLAAHDVNVIGIAAAEVALAALKSESA